MQPLSMSEQAAPAITPISLAEAKAHLRIGTSQDDALIAASIRAATEMCEAFIGIALIARMVTETLAANAGQHSDDGWCRLAHAPVRAILAVEVLDAADVATPLPVDAYAIDITASGIGRVRLTGGGSGGGSWANGAGSGRVRIRYRAGLADDANGVPEALRMGLLAMIAHLHAARDGEPGDPPALIAALWRPHRRVRVG